MEKGGFTSGFFSDSYEGIKVDPDYFNQKSTDKLKKPLAEGEFGVADGLTVSDTSALFQDKNKKVEPIKTPESDKPQVVKKILGAHVEVLEAKDRYNNDKLADITFVEGTSCGMSDAIAYIRYWTRSGTAQKNPVQSDTQFVLPDNVSEQLSKQLSELYGNSTKLSSLYTTDFDPNSIQYSPLEGYKAAESFKNLPKNEYFNKGQLPEFPNPIKTSDVDYTKVGRVYGANPSGTTLAHNVTWAAPVNDAVWQFLFNPEELQLSSGPEYNRAEAWGVSDPENSGQPLSWRMNRNRKLTFGKILLHGYSFGKRVDSLEKGLQDLFMAREGEGSDGPPVLEFVWGKRVFGPCVIQNIQVREKAWDKGILVNAEVSFELEQVPEWTINDGFVDVLRPGRQPTVNDPSVASENYRATPSSPAPTGEDDPPGNKPGGGGGEPDVTGDPNKCIQYQKTANWFATVETETNKLIGFKFPSKVDYERSFNWYEYAKNKTGNQIWGSFRPYLNKTAPLCLANNPGYIYAQPPDYDYDRAIKFINGCAKRVKDAANTWVNNEVTRPGGACVSLRDAREAKEKAENKSEAEKRKAQEEAKRCEKIGYGLPCSSKELGSTVTCNGRRRRCTRGPGPTGYSWGERLR